jgi:type I restriction-modification system DNA methylase subunit
MPKPDRTLKSLVEWSGNSETDLYPYVRDFFVDVLGYPKDHVRLNVKGQRGIPDVSLVAADVKPKSGIFWAVGEVKKIPGVFRASHYRQLEWKDQLTRYVTADTVLTFLMDPTTICLLRPDGVEVKTVELDRHHSNELTSADTAPSLANIAYMNSVSEASLKPFIEGLSPSRYLDVTESANIRERFYETLRVSTRELIDYSLARLEQISAKYDSYKRELDDLKARVGTVKEEASDVARSDIEHKYAESADFFKRILPRFAAQIGKQLPEKEEDVRRFLENSYATEGSSLILARILFIRFFEDHRMTTRKISNGGIKAFRDYHSHIKDDYRFLLTDAYRDTERLYRRLFEPSIFDWSHEGNGELSKLLLRIFYRLNSFDFTRITGDILGNLYERFLEPAKRKKVGEYYTPMFVAKYVLDRIGFFENPKNILDPAYGSGTFLIAATVGLIETLTKRKVGLELAIRQAVDLVHGLDINVFAAFIAQLQLIWHLFPHLQQAKITKMPELKVYGGVNSLVHASQKTLIASFLATPANPGEKVRDSPFTYVVGNPPYIRNERLKDHGPWRDNYDKVDFRNSDIAYFFVSRAILGKRDATKVIMPSWVEEGGRLCFVLPLGLCDSSAASVLRSEILQLKMLEVTDLEDVAVHIFPSPQASGRATVAPILLFVEKSKADPSHKTAIVQVAEKAALEADFNDSYLSLSQVLQNTFQQGEVNPFGQILTKLTNDDLPVLKKLLSNPRLAEFCSPPTPSYGIEVRGSELSNESRRGLLPLGKGQNVYTFYLSTQASKFANVGAIPSNSIWGSTQIISQGRAFALSNIGLTLQCARFDPSKFALDSAAMLIASTKHPKFAFDCLLNSSALRFVQLLTMRAGLVGVGTSIGNGRRAAWCHIYPRVLGALPVPRSLLDEPGELSKVSDQLNSLSESIVTRWITVANELEKAPKRAMALFNIDFTNWKLDIEDEEVELRLEKRGETWALSPWMEEQSTFQRIEGDYDLLNVVKYLLDQQSASRLKASTLEELPVPQNVAEVSHLIDKARDERSSDIVEFKETFRRADQIISEAFGLTGAQWTHVQRRLNSPPLDVLQPRWPWKGVAIREIKGYDIDRFA